MTFNIEWGGTHVSFDNVVETILRSEADVVGIQEAEGNLARLAEALHWHYDERNYVISKFPLFDPPGADGRYVYVETKPGRAIALANLHLPSDPYGPDLIRDGASLAEVLVNEEQVRMPALRPYLQVLPDVVEKGMPVIVTGDFNSPAHTDWTAAMVGKRPFLDYAVDWPVTTAMQDAGLHDTWREVHPDVEASPGLTWWAGRPPLPDYAPGEDDAEDRIDYIWYAGPAISQAAFIAGEADGPEVSLEVTPWPSDHRAVYADFDVEPVPIPDLVTTEHRVYTLGESVNVHTRTRNFTSPPTLVIQSADNSTFLTDTVRGTESLLALKPEAPGEYTVSVSGEGKAFERAFWVLPIDAAPLIEVERADASISVRWRNAPGHRNDYIALYEEEETDLVNGMIGFAYVGSHPHGTMAMTELLASVTDTPESARYVARLIKDDGYEVLATSEPFEIGSN